ncbi:MAG: PIG-L family deacetylase [Planctomycetota bacterium]|jgi:LmbE family N-acetylglucosaminyl deacetylase
MHRDPAALHALRDRLRRLLCVFPHPDDEAYGCAGALARAGRDPDAAVVLLCLTRGEASSVYQGRGLTADEVGRMREARMVEVAEAVAADGIVVASLPDGRLARRPLAEVSRPIADVVEAFRPQVVIGHDPRGVNAHADHIASHWAVRHALEGSSDARFAMVVYDEETARALQGRLLFPTPDDEIDAVLHLSTDEAEVKERCLRIHEALVTLREDGEPELFVRPPIERYDFLGEAVSPAVDDLFSGLSG